MKAQGVEQTKKNLKRVEKAVGDITGATEEAARKVKTNMLGMGLSFLFTGMALKRFAQAMLKNVFNAYSQIMGEGSRFMEQTNKIRAAFGFLKFSIVDALANSELFAAMVDWIINLVNGISEFVAVHPLVARLLLLFLGFLVIVGGLSMVFGQTVLAIIGWMSLMELKGMTTFGGMAGAFRKMTVAMAAMWSAFVKWAGGPMMTFWAGALILAFLFVFNAWREKLGGMKNFFGVFLIGLIEGFILVASSLKYMFQQIANGLIWLINKVIDGINVMRRAVGKAAIAHIGMVEITSPMDDATRFHQEVLAGEHGSFLQQAALAQRSAAEEEGTWEWLNPLSMPGMEAPDLDLPSAEELNITNNQNNISLEMEIMGISPEAQEEIMNATMNALIEQGYLEGGAPQA